jgi:hypothetical protein
MRQFTMTVMTLAALGPLVATAQAETQTSSPATVSGPVKEMVSQNQGLNQDFAHPPPTVRVPKRAGPVICTWMKAACISNRMAG